MVLTRKTRISGSSIVVTIPSQLVEAFNIQSGDFVEIIPIKNGEIKIKKVESDYSYEDNDLNKKISDRTS